MQQFLLRWLLWMLEPVRLPVLWGEHDKANTFRQQEMELLSF